MMLLKELTGRLSDEFVERNGRPDVIILDPPRAGVDERVLEVIKRAAPERMVYVSCNPSTQARDLALLSDMYEILEITKKAIALLPRSALNSLRKALLI